jgi:hypothetical protein
MGEVTPPPAPNPRDAKAEAAAAKAYAKAQRNWFARHKILTAIGALVVIGIIAGIAGGGGSDDKKTDSPTAGASTSTKSEPAKKDKKTSEESKAKNSGSQGKGTSAYGSAKLPLQNGDWRLDSIQLKDDGLGDFGATARITYTGEDTSGGDNIFTITVFKGTRLVGTLNGSANSVMPGTTATVQMISQDKFVGGPYKYDFQNDL